MASMKPIRKVYTIPEPVPAPVIEAPKQPAKVPVEVSRGTRV